MKGISKMTIKAIKYINNLATFDGTKSFAKVAEFNKYNIIYGYNGSGKTSLSRALRFLETRKIPPYIGNGIEVALSTDTGDLNFKLDNIADCHEKIMVFNTDFIWDNIKWSTNNMEGIATIGSEHEDDFNKLKFLKEKQAKLKIEIYGGIEKDSSGKDKKIKGLKKEVDEAKAGKDNFLTDKAKEVKNQPWNKDTGFNKTKLEGYIRKAEGVVSLSDEQFKENLKNAQANRSLPTINSFINPCSKEKLKDALTEIITNLEKSVSITKITRLKESQELETFVKQIFRGHIEQGKACPVCGEEITSDKYLELKNHFSTESEELEKELLRLECYLDGTQFSLPDAPIEERIHESYYNADSWSEYNIKKEEFISARETIKIKISDKIKNIEVPLVHEININELLTKYDLLEKAFLVVRDLINQHNTFTTNQETQRGDAEEVLKLNFAVNCRDGYQVLSDEFDSKQAVFDEAEKEFKKLPEEINEIETRISQYGKSETKINWYLKSYLGHDNLNVKLKNNAYVISRNGSTSNSPLSEGEKTALAFCYFITKLDKEDLGSFIVVVDDPISSLDARHLHYAFNFMKKHIAGANQVFVFTHNFAFFKECKKSLGKADKWVKDVTNPKVQNRIDGNQKLFYISKEGNVSYLEDIPEILKRHESEYHFFAEQLFEASKGSDIDCYMLANACRKVLETFLYFKCPSNSDSIADKFESVLKQIPDEKKEGEYDVHAKSKERLVQIESHGDNIDKLLGLEDATLMSMGDTVEFVLNFIEKADKCHFDTLKKAVKA